MSSYTTAARTSTASLSDIRFHRDVQRLYAHGPRVIAELLSEIGAERNIQHLIDRKVARYAALPAESPAVSGGDRLPPAPLHEVR